MMIIALRTVSGLLQERFLDYYKNGFGIIMRTVLGLLRKRFWDYYRTVSDYYTTVSDYYGNGFRLLRERFQIITGTVLRLLWERFQIITGMVPDYYGNGSRLLQKRFQIITGTLLERFEDIWERFVVTMQDGHRYYGTVLILIEQF